MRTVFYRLQQESKKLTRVKPCWQEAVCIRIFGIVKMNRIFCQHFLQLAIIEGVEGLCAATDMFTADKNLRNRGGIGFFAVNRHAKLTHFGG